MIAENLCMSCMKEIGSQKQCPYCGFHIDTPQIAPYLPLRTVIGGRYIIGKKIKSGGDGVTYMGWDAESKTPITVREYLPENIAVRDYPHTQVQIRQGKEDIYFDGMDAFLALWRKLARGRNLTALIPVIDIIEENDTAYAISEYIETITLRDFLLRSKTGYLTWEKVKILLMPVLTTVSSLHSMQVYHRAISPDTLVLGRDGKLRLTDFMIAEARCLKTSLSAELFPGYAAIEQYTDIDDTGVWTDIYAIGAVVYRSLVGSIPVEATERVTNDKLMIPPKFAEALPAYLVSALEHSLMIEPNDRTASIDDLREELSGSPSTMASNQMHTPEVEASGTSEEELETRRILELQAVREQHRSEQIKMMLIAFAVVLGIGVLAFGGYFGANYIKEHPKETTTVAPAAEMLEVPDYRGQNYARISSDDVQKTRFEFIASYEYSDEVDVGNIISQDLEPGSTVEKGSKINVVVSKGRELVVLPDVIGSDYEEAEKILTEAGFVCKKIEKNNDGTHTDGEVVSLTPEAGGQYERGKEIYVQVWGEGPTTTTSTSTTKRSIIDSIGESVGLF